MCGWRSGYRFGVGPGFWPNPSTALPSSRPVTTPTIETDFGVISIAISCNFVAMTWAGSWGGVARLARSKSPMGVVLLVCSDTRAAMAQLVGPARRGDPEGPGQRRALPTTVGRVHHGGRHPE